jgi:hypothetical protein
MINTKANTFTVTLTSEAYRIAERRRKGIQQLENAEQKSKQIYLNTLAVYAVAFYCRCMGIETSWQNSNIFDAICTILLDVSDIELVGLGKLECRPVLPGEMNCFIPFESRESRIGYVAVEVDNSTKEATILGFYPSFLLDKVSETIPLYLLKSIDDMLDYLLKLEEIELESFSSDDPVAIKSRETLVGISSQEFMAKLEESYYAGAERDSEYLADEWINKTKIPWKPKELINLSRWLLSPTLNSTSVLLENGYLEVSEYLQKFSNPNLRLANTLDVLNHTSRIDKPVGAVKRFQLGGCKFILYVATEIKSEKRRDLAIRVCMDDDHSSTLPENLRLLILDELGSEVFQKQSRSSDNVIGVDFRAELGDQFKLELFLDNYSFSESYDFSDN